MQDRIIILLVIFLLPITAFAKDEPLDLFERILEEQWQRRLDENPVSASYLGDKRANQDWPDISNAAVRGRQKKDREVLEKIRSIDPETLPDSEQQNYRLFLYNYERAVDSQRFDRHLLPFSQRGGIQLEHETAEGLSFQTKQDYEDWLIRLTKLPALISAHIELAKLGIQKGITAPKVLME